MSITAASCDYYRALSVSGVPTNPTLVSFACWVRALSTVASRGLISLDTADSAFPDTGVRLQVNGSSGLGARVATGGSIQQGGLEPERYIWQSWYTGTRPWVLLCGWIDTSQSAADGKLYFDGTTYVANGTENIGNLGLMDDFFVLRRSSVGPGWGGGTDAQEPDLRIAHLALWFGYKITDTDVTNMKAGTNPQTIGTGATKRFYWPFRTSSGDGLTDRVSNTTLAPFNGTAAWQDADNPTVDNPPSLDPVLSSPAVSAVTATTATVGATTDQAAGIFYVVATNSTTSPTAAQIKLGQDHTGAAASTYGGASGSVAVSSANPSLTLTGLLTGSTRRIYAVQTASGRDSAVLSYPNPVYPGTWRSAAEVSASGWTYTGAASFAAAVNEDAASDAEYAQSPSLSATPTVRIDALDRPVPAGTYLTKVRTNLLSGTGFVRISFLDNSNTVLGQSSAVAINSTVTTYDVVTSTSGTATRRQIELWV